MLTLHNMETCNCTAMLASPDILSAPSSHCGVLQYLSGPFSSGTVRRLFRLHFNSNARVGILVLRIISTLASY